MKTNYRSVLFSFFSFFFYRSVLTLPEFIFEIFSNKSDICLCWTLYEYFLLESTVFNMFTCVFVFVCVILMNELLNYVQKLKHEVENMSKKIEIVEAQRRLVSFDVRLFLFFFYRKHADCWAREDNVGCRKLLGERLEACPFEELHELESQLDKSLGNIRRRKVYHNKKA